MKNCSKMLIAKLFMLSPASLSLQTIILPFQKQFLILRSHTVPTMKGYRLFALINNRWISTVFRNTELLTLLSIAALVTECVMAVLIKDLFSFSVSKEIIFSPHC